MTFICSTPYGGYDWVVLPYLNGTNGRVTPGQTVTVGMFTLSASGTGAGRRSSLQVAAFSGLSNVTITCREASGNPNVTETAVVTVLGKEKNCDLNCNLLHSVNLSKDINLGTPIIKNTFLLK